MDSWGSILLGTLFVIICVLLIIVVLLQKGRGGGLGAAFGGGGQSAFGTRTGDVFTWVTIVLTGLFLVLAVGTTMIVRPPQTALPAPTITPTAENAVPGPDGLIMVTMTGPKGAEVWYTIDGNDPVKGKEGSFKFEATPRKVKPGTTVKAQAVRAGHQPSEIVSVRYLTAEEQEQAQREAEQAATRPAPATTVPAETQPTPPTTQPTQPAVQP